MALLGGVVRVGAQDAEAGAGDGAQRVVLAQLVLAVAEEGEVVVGEPAQQLAGLLDLRHGQVGGDGLTGQRLGERGRGLAHLAPVLDGLADVGEDPQQVGGDLLEVAAVGLAVDLHMDPGLDVRVVRQAAGVLGEVAADGAVSTSISLPVTSRRTTTWGWMTTWMPRPWRVSSLVTESTRKGMSSVTTSTTEWLDGRGVDADAGRALGRLSASR
ncbi:hypothetical protein SHKM778_84530 [Streptomyces sp. KM77-8]|uniref:Uncharacterized protein n=1 Tax=Streptomyces haneummycinicus TaxID=3074435 RepID=A0AAT9HXG2_9ACTN